MKKTDNYVAVLADVIASRTLAPRERAQLQAELQRRLRTELNRHRAWRPHIAAGFALAGDEVEGLLHDAAPVWEIAHWLRATFAGVDWIVACARGPISTALAPSAIEVDGPCFHAARAALLEAKPRRQVFTLRGFPPGTDGMAAYYSALYWSWTPRQRRVAAVLRLHGPWLDAPPPPLSPRLDTHPTAISHMKRRMAWPLVAAGDKILRSALLEAR